MLSEGRIGKLRGGAVAEIGLSRDGYSQAVTASQGRYSEATRNGEVFFGHYIVAADLVVRATEAGQQGVLWNPSDSGVDVALLLWSFAQTVAATDVGDIGLQFYLNSTASGESTAATSLGAAYAGRARAKALFSGVSTVTGADGGYFPMLAITTAAVRSE